MKKFVGILAALLLIVGAWSFAPAAQASETGLFTIHQRSEQAPSFAGLTPHRLALQDSEPKALRGVISDSSALLARVNTADQKRQELVKGKLDLNNSDVREFRRLRGFYPSLASKIIQNAPYNTVEDVLDIPGLSDTQIERLQANIDEFFVTDVEASMNAGGDRYNPGLY